MRRWLVIVGMFYSLLVVAKKPTVSGYIIDSQTGERLIGATILDSKSGEGTVTNVNGFYSLTLVSDSVRLQARYVGYEGSGVESFWLKKDTLIEIRLTSVNMLDEVVIEGTQSISGTHSAQMSAVEIPINQIKGIPTLGGEVDVLKAIQLLPGVQSGSEGASGLYVRGGGPDENLIMLDGVPLYSVSHMLGFFSVFNDDAVKNVTLYQGNFPARYGGRLSSIIDVRQKDGDAYGYHGNLTVGLVSTKLSVEGPIKKGKTTFFVSARRTLYDLILPPIVRYVTKRQSNGNDVTTGGYYFLDVNAKLTHTFSENDKISGTFYFGDDGVNARRKTNIANNNGPQRLKLRYNWGNILASVNHEHRYNGRLYSNTQVSFTRYKYKLATTYDEYANTYDEVNVNYDSYIMDVMAHMNFNWQPNTRHNIHFGARYTYHQFRPQVGRYAATPSSAEGQAIDTTVNIGQTNHNHEANIYIEDTYTPCSWFKMNMGLHASLYHADGSKTYPSIEPRLGLRFLPHKDFAIKISYAYMSQYAHMLSNSSVSMPTDLWVPVTADIPPMHSMQVAAGITYNILNQVELTVEGYYKKMLNLLEYKDGASYMSGDSWQDQVCIGNGWSYGVEVLAQRKVGPVTGWIGYTWSRTMRQFDKEGQQINFGKPFHAKYDREHDLSVTLQYQISKSWSVAATFVYGTGTRGTLALQKYEDGLYNSEFYGKDVKEQINFISERNNYKTPDYHRLDLGATCHIPDKKHAAWDHILNISVYNAYCNFNPFLIYVKDSKLYQFSLLPILPSLSYTFKF